MDSQTTAGGTYRSTGLRPWILCNQIMYIREILRQMKLFPPRIRHIQSATLSLLRNRTGWRTGAVATFEGSLWGSLIVGASATNE